MDLQGFFTSDCPAVMPGFVRVQYLDTGRLDAGFEAIIAPDGVHRQTVPVTNGNWLSLYAMPDSGSWSEQAVTNEQGTHYAVQVSFSIAADAPADRAEVSAMRGRRYLLQVPDHTGAPLLIGTQERPLRFISAFDSGSADGGTRRTTFTFSGVALRPSPGYIPTF